MSHFQGPKIADSISDLIGRTPLVRLRRLAEENGVVANILLKLESLEPCRYYRCCVMAFFVLDFLCFVCRLSLARSRTDLPRASSTEPKAVARLSPERL
jgi:hypothetical protein